jgi:hypothetical protein
MFARFFLALALLAPPLASAAEPVLAPERTAQLLAREDELLERLGERDPAMRDRLLALRASDRDAYLAQLARLSKLADRYDDDPAFAARVDDIAALEERVRTLADSWRAASAADRPGIRAEMVGVAGQIFELKQAERRQRIAEYQARLDRLEAEVADIEAKRTDVIDRWVGAALARP